MKIEAIGQIVDRKDVKLTRNNRYYEEITRYNKCYKNVIRNYM